MASPGRLASARDARSLTYAIRDLEAKLGPVKVKTNRKGDEEVKDLIDLNEEKTDSGAKNVMIEDQNLVDKNEETNMATKQVRFEEVPAEKEATATAKSYSKGSDDHIKGESNGKRELVESAADTSASSQENSKESPSKREECLSSAAEFGKQTEKEEMVKPIKEEPSTPTIQQEQFNSGEVLTESSPKESSSVKNELSTELPLGLERMNGDQNSAEVRVEGDNKM